MTPPTGSPSEPVVSRPWTPGPWLYANRGPEDQYGVVAQTEGRMILAPAAPDVWDERAEAGVDMDDQDEADTQLIALAPELAEAILAYDVQRGDCEAWGGLDVLAERLRAIGGPA